MVKSHPRDRGSSRVDAGPPRGRARTTRDTHELGKRLPAFNLWGSDLLYFKSHEVNLHSKFKRASEKVQM